jgi:hypothetical protein
MSKKLTTSIEINASPNAVWQVLTDFGCFPQWNPFIRSIRGEATQGAQLHVQIQPPNGAGMTFHPKVLIAEPGYELRWLGQFLLPGIFDGEHHFHIELLSEHRVRFVQSEVFSGLLVSLLWSSLDTKTRQGFEEMNQALKLQAELYNAG